MLKMINTLMEKSRSFKYLFVLFIFMNPFVAMGAIETNDRIQTVSIVVNIILMAIIALIVLKKKPAQ